MHSYSRLHWVTELALSDTSAPRERSGDAVPLLNVALVPAPDLVVVRLTGESDLSTAGQLSDALAQAAGLGTDAVVVDVAAVRFWDCSGLHALADFTADLATAGRQCRIVGATAPTRRLVVLAGFAPALALDGPVHHPAVSPVAAPTPTMRADQSAGVVPSVAAAAAARRRASVPRHPAPTRRRVDRSTGEARGASLALRRWR
jgi:anti-anti-sigma factor